MYSIILAAALVQKASCGSIWLNANCTPFLDAAPLLYEQPSLFGRTRVAFRLVIVPQMPGQKALMCFERKDKETIRCLYNSTDDEDDTVSEYDVWPLAPDSI